MSEVESSTSEGKEVQSALPVSEKSEPENGFNKTLHKVMGHLGFTSGIGIVGIGGFWFIYSLLQYIFITPKNVMQQSIVENYFNQAQMGLLIAAIGVLIMEIKKLRLK
ncbi:hypothetical protein [Alteromonas sp. a30]|uniref:hypothetical protein n=1 Tax=Alteromonas sp. a30 TaxID=2730917 RepID=UPI00227EEE1C|nr:hypothetical protein [Alteromonas sp. a30]MCY7294908.1 hypothetical protein [Alteromonas sp. a30]